MRTVFSAEGARDTETLDEGFRVEGAEDVRLDEVASCRSKTVIGG